MPIATIFHLSSFVVVDGHEQEDVSRNLRGVCRRSWAAGPRQKASWEFVPRGMSLSFK